MNKPLVIGVLLALLLFLGFDSIYVVNEGEQTITTQFGDPIGEKVISAGLYFKIPLIHKVRFFDKRILKWDGEPNEIPTKDKTYIWVDTTARWRIDDPLLFLQRMGNLNRADVVLSDLINGAVRDFVTKNKLVEVVRSSDWSSAYSLTSERASDEEDVVVSVGRDRFSQLVLSNVSAKTDALGIELLDVLVTRINYTDQVRDKVFARMISERQRIATKRRSEGEAIKAEVLGQMAKNLKGISSKAYRTSMEIRGKADAEVTKLFGNAYNKDPEFFKFLMTLDTYKDVLGSNTRLVIGASSPLYQYLQGKPRR